MNHFEPSLDILPPPQRKLWPELSMIPKDFVLYGGTGIALYLGHRQSVDFDFFSSLPFDEDHLFEKVPFLEKGEIIQQENDSLSLMLHRDGPVKLSFFGGLNMGRVAMPSQTNDGILRVASLLDLFGCKLAVMLKRPEKKDYMDIAALIRNGQSLAEGLATAKALYPRFSPIIGLKALTYFKDGDLSELAERDKQTILQAVNQFDKLPEISIQGSISPDHFP
jgi:hypothetical protein